MCTKTAIDRIITQCGDSREQIKSETGSSTCYIWHPVLAGLVVADTLAGGALAAPVAGPGRRRQGGGQGQQFIAQQLHVEMIGAH